jgi:hypothetical protein
MPIPIEAYGIEALPAIACRRRRRRAGGGLSARRVRRIRQAWFAQAGIDPIFLLAPTSTEQRYSEVGEIGSGYIYYVSLKGVTGSGHARPRRSRATHSADPRQGRHAGRRRLRHP